MVERIFINMYGYDSNWIISKIADDIIRTASSMGYECGKGGFEDYRGEEICYHMCYQLAIPISQAKHNSVFYTHLNDKLTEEQLISIKDQFDSYICMSAEDAEFLIELGFDPHKVYGKTLPVRNNYIRPISIGIFSACYPDGRKNEEWLLDYCRQCEGAKLVNFVFVGKGWGRVVDELEKLDCSYEWHNVSRKLPYEYQYQQNKMGNLNYYIYMGMDGGAMGTYDAYAQDVPLCVTYDGFHKSIPDIDYSFDDKQGFFNQLDKITSSHKRRMDFFQAHTPENYVKWILDIWHGNGNNVIDEKDRKCISYNTVLEKKRDQYYDLVLNRFRGFLADWLVKIRYKIKYKL